MVTKTRVGFTLAIGAAMLVFAALDVAADEGGDAVDWSARAKEAWTDNCQKCHTVPDSRYETDRGFLAQVMETT